MIRQNNNTFEHHEYNMGEFDYIGYKINLTTRRIEFFYGWKDFEYETNLLADCSFNAEERIKAMLKENHITVVSAEDSEDYYSIVLDGLNLVFHKE